MGLQRLLQPLPLTNTGRAGFQSFESTSCKGANTFVKAPPLPCEAPKFRSPGPPLAAMLALRRL